MKTERNNLGGVLAIFILVLKLPAAHGQLILPGETKFDHLFTGQTNWHTFDAVAGENITLKLASVVSALDPEMRVYGPNGAYLYQAYGYGPVAVTKDFVAPQSGTYSVMVRDLDSGAGDYFVT